MENCKYKEFLKQLITVIIVLLLIHSLLKMKAIIMISLFYFLGIVGNLSNYHIRGFSTKLQTLRGNVKPIIQPKKNIPKLNSNMTRARGKSKSCETYFLVSFGPMKCYRKKSFMKINFVLLIWNSSRLELTLLRLV